MSLVLRCLKRMVWIAGSAGLVASLSSHGLLALVVLAVLVVVLALLGRAMLRWTISSGPRSDRMIRMILALRGDGRSLPQGHAALSSPRLTAPSPGPGRLYDCPVCEAACRCTPGDAECVYSVPHKDAEDEQRTLAAPAE